MMAAAAENWRSTALPPAAKCLFGFLPLWCRWTAQIEAMHTISFRLRPTFIFHDLKFLFLQRAVQCYRTEHRGTIKAKLRPTDSNEIKDPLYLKRNIFISLEFVCPSSKRFVVFVLRTVVQPRQSRNPSASAALLLYYILLMSLSCP